MAPKGNRKEFDCLLTRESLRSSSIGIRLYQGSRNQTLYTFSLSLPLNKRDLGFVKSFTSTSKIFKINQRTITEEAQAFIFVSIFEDSLYHGHSLNHRLQVTKVGVQ